MTTKILPYRPGHTAAHARPRARTRYAPLRRMRDTWSAVFQGLRDQLGLLHQQTAAEADASLIEVQVWMLSVRPPRAPAVAASLRASTLAVGWLVEQGRQRCPLVMEFRAWMVAEGLA